ncbi:MAG: PaaI family thioesterase [Clostridia bacterium]|nr:PaaI family thioesterase [Clostridia bacterium]MDD4047299.1 PaaI family thioesterase [Clostridia bacterium]
MTAIQNKGVDESLFEEIVTLNKGFAFHNNIDIFIVSVAPGEVVVEAQINEKHLNTQKLAHGGVTFSIADTAMGMSIKSLNIESVTIEANINYTKPAFLGNTLRAYGKVLSSSRKILIAQAEIKNEKDELVAIARGTFYKK